jgi:hypothetical protein
MVARESGIVHRYSLPMLTLETKDLLHCRPQGSFHKAFLDGPCNNQ